jgi:hypothetical protein
VVQQNWAGIKFDFIAPPLFAVRKTLMAGNVLTLCLVCTCLFAIVFCGLDILLCWLLVIVPVSRAGIIVIVLCKAGIGVMASMYYADLESYI